MRHLFRTALLGRQHRFLIACAIVFMILLTFASQLEIVALGIITRKGPDFFELFAPVKDGKLQKRREVSWENVQERWKELDYQGQNKITPADTTHFLAEYKGLDLVEKVTHFVNQSAAYWQQFKSSSFFSSHRSPF